MLSGSNPNVHGIISNEWFDAHTGKVVYCQEDEQATIIGFSKEPGRSPKNFLGSTVGDQLRLSNAASKVIAISNKDRSAILMGGKLANAAYWMVDSMFTTSTYYMPALPEWVQKFNGSGHVSRYFGNVWDRVLPEKAYAVQGPDDVDAEKDEAGLGRTFPHKVDGGADRITKNFLRAFDVSPFSSEVLAEFAKEALVQERLGLRGVTDILCIGFSANDRIGHNYGPHSHEVMDITIRTDRILEQLFAFIDQKIGLRNCLLILTSDHGVAPLPEVLKTLNPHADAGRIDESAIRDLCEEALTKTYGTLQGSTWIIAKTNANIYLNQKALRERDINVSDAEEILKQTLLRLSGIHAVYTRTQLLSGRVTDDLGKMALYSFHPERTGNVFFQLKPYYLEERKVGTGHGEPWSYDAHVPMLWYGAGIKPGNYHEDVAVADLAPTLCALLGIEFPAGMQGRVLQELLK
jgi:hypothetical protein